MSVDVLQGSPLENLLIPASGLTLGSAAGRTFVFNNVSWCTFVSGHPIITSTATVGNRLLIFQILDAQGNIVFEASPGTVLPASAQFRYPIGAFLPNYGASAIVSIPISYPLYVPPLASLKVFDQANIDPNDFFNSFPIVLST